MQPSATVTSLFDTKCHLTATWPNMLSQHHPTERLQYIGKSTVTFPKSAWARKGPTVTWRPTTKIPFTSSLFFISRPLISSSEKSLSTSRGGLGKLWHNYSWLGFNHSLLGLLSAHYLRANTDAPLCETDQFILRMSLTKPAITHN